VGIFQKLQTLPVSQRLSFAGQIGICIGSALCACSALIRMVENGAVPTDVPGTLAQANTVMTKARHPEESLAASYFNS